MELISEHEIEFYIYKTLYTKSLKPIKHLIENGADIYTHNHYLIRSASENRCSIAFLYLKSIYIQKYKEKFLCHKCLVLPCCTELCSDELIKGD